MSGLAYEQNAPGSPQREPSDYDAEKGDLHQNADKEQVAAVSTSAAAHEFDRDPAEGHVKRALKARHLQMIALGGTIGTGLFVGSGEALTTGGPLGILLAYTIMGTIVYSVMVSLGEMCTLFPVSGAFTHYATRFVHPALGFAMGWNYWYSFAITLPTEITAAGIVISYWDKTTNVAVWITIFLIIICCLNFFGVRYYGEAEFWFSLMKITTIVGLIILGLILDLGGGPDGHRRGFQYWKNPGPFTQLNGIPGATGRFLAFWSLFVQAAFSYIGTEIIAMTVGEAENPRRNVPKAIRRIFYRILLFYVLGVLVIGWLVPSNDPELLQKAGSGTASASPFVIAIQRAGIKGLPSVINAAVLISAFSAGNSDLFTASRTLYSLALDGKAPHIFRYCDRRGVPYWCLAVTAVIGVLAYLNVGSGSATVFNWFYNISSITGLLTWEWICFTYIRFYAGTKAQGIDRNTFPYKAPFQPFAAWWGFLWCTVIIFFNGFGVFLSHSWDVSTFLTAYIGVPIFIGFFVIWKLYSRTKMVSVHEMDFQTGARELDELNEKEEARYVPPRTWYQKIWAWLM